VAPEPGRFDELIGYADRWSVAPGETVSFMVSTTAARFDASLVRLLHGDEHPAGPGFREVELPVALGGPFPGRRQGLQMGSYATAPPLGAADALSLAAWIGPTRCALERPQVVLAAWEDADDGAAGIALELAAGGVPAVRVGTEAGVARLAAERPLVQGAWYLLAGCADVERAALRLYVAALRPEPGEPSPVLLDRRADAPLRLSPRAPVTLAAAGSPAREHFNGKVEDPAAWTAFLDPDELDGLARGAPVGEGPARRWDLSIEPAGDVAVDVSGDEAHARLVNLPTRAVTGRRFTGRELDVRHAPAQYAAVHFHDDDVEDAGWEPDVALTVPAELPSGVYAARLRTDTAEDHVPFVVRPAPGTRGADVLLLLPTLTYLAYANERQIAAESTADLISAPGTTLTPDPADLWLAANPAAGLSCYDTHSDGSGCCYSSRLRPIPNLRPRYRFWSTGGPERFAADLHLVDWLDHEGFGHDVACDEDLHAEGQPLLDRYPVVLTGTHPEYWTEPMLDALAGYLEGGGRLMYLGGNGFYWVTSIDPGRPHVAEVRRGVNGSRAWTSAPGEAHHSTTGEPGGLWRYRGRPPNALVGVGFTAQSDSHEPAAGYVRLPDSHDPRAAFVFEGVGEEEVVGEFGLVNGGAAGYEVDRVDHALGTPRRALRLATSRGRHNDSYLFVVEDLLFSQHGTGGTRHPGVGADLVLLEYPNGGAVFSVGSCTWCASLSHAGYANNVARITANVLRRFRDAADKALE
jgi:N,N-dimethylformamidase